LDGRLGDLSSDAGQLYATLVVRETFDDDQSNYAYVDDARDVGAGTRHSCLLTKSGLVECWGDDDAGQLGDHRKVKFSDHAIPVASLSGVTRIAVGAFHTCAVQLGQVYCWGDNGAGQLGRPSSVDDDQPEPVPELHDIVEIVAGYSSTCARDQQGAVVCWGLLVRELLQAPDTVNETPRKLDIGSVDQLALGGHLCFTDADAQVHCWGSNMFGQLGNGSTSIDPKPELVTTKAVVSSKP
jgi:alpha-tubulin suppressor-like RCC1 family protein